MIEQPLITPNSFSSKANITEVLRRLNHRRHTAMNPRNKLTVTQEQYNKYYKFAFVRNPWARAFSWYKNVMRDAIHRENYKITSDLSFKDFLPLFVGKGLLRPQTYWLKSFDGSIKLDYIGRFETLAEDFQRICRAMHISPIDLPHEIKGSYEDYRQHYDEELISLVAEVYQEEIEIFNYSFSPNLSKNELAPLRV